MEPEPQDCRSPVGVTVGLIDAIISIARVLASRDNLGAPQVSEALADLRGDEDLTAVLGRSALCNEAESLRARLAEAPEVLREWPTTDKPGAWVWLRVDGRAPLVGLFGGPDVAFMSRAGRTYWRNEFRSGEFFVRVP